MPTPAEDLQRIQSFDDLVRYLEDELDWPLQAYDFEELTFEYAPAEVGLKEQDAVKVKRIHQLRPLHAGQPWGIFFVEFERKKLPIVLLRRILSHLVVKRRTAAGRAHAATWEAADLLFISAYGGSDIAGVTGSAREIAFAHFHQEAGDLPTLRVLGWDGDDTALKLQHVAAVLRQQLRWPELPADADAWRTQWSAAFRHRPGHVITTADALAEALAALARGIRLAALTLLDHESEQGALRSLHRAFQRALIHDLSAADFADTYAQTITYGLLTAAISRTEMSEGRYGTALTASDVTAMVPITNPFLREMLQTFLRAGGQSGAIDFDELGVQEVVELLRGEATDLPAILRDFGNKTQGEDPVIHFYEHFLAAYDKALKVKRGVFYTPRPVVAYIVRSVDEVLRREFGLEDGLAATVTWGEMVQRLPGLTIPEGVAADSPFVMMLDVATGTGTFIVEVIEVVHQTMMAKWRKQGLNEAQRLAAWNEYVPAHLLPRLYGYELMMAPYAIAHMKIGLKLHATGYRFGSDERVRVYLTNTLELADDVQQTLDGILPALAHEAQAVNAVKRNVRFTVVMGNPPYANFGQMNRNPFILTLLDDYKRGLNERKNNIGDDFIKFMRFCQFLIEASGVGVVGLITNNTFLDGVTHRIMRRSLTKVFNQAWFLDLHGSVMKKETAPDSGHNDNVFDIKQGVCISIWTRILPLDIQTSRYSELWGDRLEKYAYLRGHQMLNTAWQPLSLTPPAYFFTPRTPTTDDAYASFFSLTDIYVAYVSGIQTGRDSFVSSDSTADFDERIQILVNNGLSDSEIGEIYELPDFSGFDLARLRQTLKNKLSREQAVVNWLYRPFDIRPLLFHESTIKRQRGAVMQSLLEPNIALISVRQLAKTGFTHVFVTRHIGGSTALNRGVHEHHLSAS